MQPGMSQGSQTVPMSWTTILCLVRLPGCLALNKHPSTSHEHQYTSMLWMWALCCFTDLEREERTLPSVPFPRFRLIRGGGTRRLGGAWGGGGSEEGARGGGGGEEQEGRLKKRKKNGGVGFPSRSSRSSFPSSLLPFFRLKKATSKGFRFNQGGRTGRSMGGGGSEEGARGGRGGGGRLGGGTGVGGGTEEGRRWVGAFF